MAEKEIDYSDLEERYAVVRPDLHKCIIVVDNLPQVNKEKLEKLEKLISKKLLASQTIKEIHMPFNTDSDPLSKGFAFITLATPEQAQASIKLLDAYKLDKSHILACNPLSDIEKYSSMSLEFSDLTIDPYTEKEHLKSWCIDERGRDQWVTMTGEEVGIYFNNKSEPAELVHSRKKWSDLFVSWSPKGTYLATFHPQGVILWGGPSWSRINRFPHTNVRLVDFSPCEQYIVTWTFEGFQGDDGSEHHIAIWEISTGLKLRSFPLDPTTLPQSTDGKSNAVKVNWPIFKWSHDDLYFARITGKGEKGMISVYETPGMGLVGKKSFKIPDVQSFAWSPADHSLAYWTPESGNIPARVTVIKIPSREIIRTKNLFNVIDCKLYWQSAGDYLLVQVEKIRSKKSTVVNFEIFRLREKDCPVDVLECNPTETITHIAWEPRGDRFSVLATEGQKVFVYFYQMANIAAATAAGVVEGVKLLKVVERKGINQILWSPRGRFCVLAGIRGFQGDLEFWDADDLIMMGSGDHYMCTDIEWDPTGRYLVSSISMWHVASDTGFIVWTFTGTQLLNQKIPHFKQFLWRPRPPTLLTEAKQKLIRKNLKEYSRGFEEIDAAMSIKVSREIVEKRLGQWKEWKEFRDKCMEVYRGEQEERKRIWGGVDPVFVGGEGVGGEFEEVEEVVEEVLEELEEIVE